MRYFLLLFYIIGFFSCTKNSEKNKALLSLEQSGAGVSLDFWAYARGYPDGKIKTKEWEKSYHQYHSQATERSGDADWTALGPKNIGGRTLCLAFHPNDNNTIFAGSASGGLWKTTTNGVGYVGWEQVPIDFPVLGIPTIAINQENPDEMYIGTGEIYNNQSTMPGVVNRFTRGSYGIGILKTTDGGATWSKSLDWAYQDLQGVSEIVMHPDDSNIVFAATSDGFYRTEDGGSSWEKTLDLPMTYHIAVRPDNPQIVFVTVGAYQNENTGIYRSTDGGMTFDLLGGGAPAGYTGKARIKIYESDYDIMYCSAADSDGTNNYGLYKSLDGGDNWEKVNSENVPTYQGWYAHDVAIDPDNHNTAIWVGVDLYKTTNSGASLEQKSYWYNWDFGQTPVGGPEGPGDYVHADIHAVYWHPVLQNTVYAATDGGIFVSSDNGETWQGRNGSYQTQQFYANFSSSNTNPNRAIGGMQDNATALYLGTDSWKRVIGGDGGGAAQHPTDDNTVYGTSQYLGLRKSTNGGNNFNFIAPGQADDEYTCFIAPIEISSSSPQNVYAGAQRLYHSTNGGNSWNATSAAFPDGLNPIVSIGLSDSDLETIYISTVANPFVNNPEPSKVFKSTNGGENWTQQQGLPDRMCTDFAIRNEETDFALCTFSGFGTAHLYYTTDGGVTWNAFTEGLPDVPTNSVVIDPDFSDIVYVANDLGIFVIEGADDMSNASAVPYQTGLPNAILAMHLDIQDSERKLRVATHGNGIWESSMIVPTVANENVISDEESLEIYPNPAVGSFNLLFKNEGNEDFKVEIYSIDGRLIKTEKHSSNSLNVVNQVIDIQGLANGQYVVKVESEKISKSTRLTVK